MIKLIPQDYVWEWERNSFPYYLHIFASVWLDDSFNLPDIYTLFLFNRGITDAYMKVSSLNKTAKKLIGYIINDPSYFPAWRKYSHTTARQLHRFCDKLENINWPKLNDERLLKILADSIKIYSRHTENVATIRDYNRLALSILQKKYSLADLAILLATDKKSFFTNEHEDLLQIADKIRRGELSSAAKNKLLAHHTAKYFYSPCGYYLEKTLTVKDFKNKLVAIIKKKETLQQFRRKNAAAAQERRALIRRLSISRSHKKIIEFGSACTYFKDFIRGNLNRLNYFNILIFKEIARRTGNSWLAIANQPPSTLIGILKKRQKVTVRQTVAIYSDRHGIHEITGRAVEKIIDNFKKDLLSSAPREIKGISANRGMVRGRALVIKNISEVGNLKDYILVTSMTTPDLMPAIKKSLAIVTDEGGLTCHAAIVARELNRPCVIGTKTASKIIKTGDVVEVDAEKGIVKIIKR